MSTPIVIDVASGNSKTIKQGSIGCGLVGAFFVLCAVLAAFGRNASAAIVAGVLGLVIIAIGLYPLLRPQVFLRPRRFVVDPAGIRWDDPKGASWALRWDELRAVEVSSSGPRLTRVGYAARRTHAALVRVDLFPRSDVAHPEMAHLWEFDDIKGGWRVPLGPNPELITQLDTAFRTFDRAGVYRGVVDGDAGLF